MLFDIVCTTDDVDKIMRLVDLLSNSLYRVNGPSWDQLIKSQASPELVPYFEVSENDRKTFLDDLKRKLQDLKVIKLKIAFVAPSATLARICAWIRSNVAADIVLEVEVDHDLIAGAQISFAGKYIDASKRSQLDRILEKYAGF